MMQPETETTPKPERKASERATKLDEYVGVVHVHTKYSDGVVDMGSVIDSARDAGLDFVVITDHNRITALEEGWQGLHDGVLIIVGAEISARAGHCIALNLEKVGNIKQLRKKAPAEFLRIIARNGGHSFIAHPRGNIRREFNINVKSWNDWDLETFDGIEIWSYMHDWVRNITLTSFFEAARNPGDFITGPPAGVLKMWDELGRSRRVVGIGALDSHCRGVPFNWFPWKLTTLFPLGHIFQTVRTHVLAEPHVGDDRPDLDKTIAALAGGRCFVDYLPNGDGTGFEFNAFHPERPAAMMGDDVAAGNWTLAVRCPIHARIRILRDGQPIAETTGTELDADATGPGVYRVEATRDAKPWLFSNPIYIRQKKPDQ